MLFKLGIPLSLLLGVVFVYRETMMDSLDWFYASFIHPSHNTDRLFTAEELSAFDGVASKHLYLSILGRVYDVTEGRRHYEKGSSYHIFVGRDASRAFISGEFSEGAANLDDVLVLSPTELTGLENWIQTYDEKYKYKGKLIGRYYDNRGRETDYNRRVKAKIEEGKIIEFKKAEADKLYPPCNSEWSADAGSRVWCTEKSGGIERHWVGLPRRMHTPGLSSPICVCVNPNNAEHMRNPHLREFEGCDPKSASCRVATD